MLLGSASAKDIYVLLFLHVVIPTCTYVYICILYPCHRYLAWLEQELITLSAK